MEVIVIVIEVIVIIIVIVIVPKPLTIIEHTFLAVELNLDHPLQSMLRPQTKDQHAITI